MRYEARIVATSHRDRHGDRLLPEGLKGNARQSEQRYTPIMVNHDPRIAPIGRTLSSKVFELPDGESALVVLVQYFDNDEDIPIDNSGRELPIWPQPQNELAVIFDQSYRSEEYRRPLEDLANLLKAPLQFYGKKALEPVSTLWLIGAFLAGGIASGFLGKIGADGWDLLKDKIKRAMKRRADWPGERLLVLEFQAVNDSRTVSVKIIIEDPDDDSLEIFKNRLSVIDDVAIRLIEHPELKQVVLRLSDGKLSQLYALRRDAVPRLLEIDLEEDINV